MLVKPQKIKYQQKQQISKPRLNIKQDNDIVADKTSKYQQQQKATSNGQRGKSGRTKVQ